MLVLTLSAATHARAKATGSLDCFEMMIALDDYRK